MYYGENTNVIEVVLPSGASVYIDRTSYFYEGIRELITAHKEIRDAQLQIKTDSPWDIDIEDISQMHESIDDIEAKLESIIEKRALVCHKAQNSTSVKERFKNRSIS